MEASSNRFSNAGLGARAFQPILLLHATSDRELRMLHLSCHRFTRVEAREVDLDIYCLGRDLQSDFPHTS